MKIVSGREDAYLSYVALNSKDDYSKGVVDYSERWANLMEPLIQQGEKIQDIAQQTSRKADIDGITGFMYGCAVKALAHFWIYGDDLRKWHNNEYGISEEKAKGGTVNPAILTIGENE